MKDLFGNESDTPSAAPVAPSGKTVWKGRIPYAEEKTHEAQDFYCLTRPRPYVTVRESKTQIWILNQ